METTMKNEKIWFITGASKGFGRIWAEAALQRGDKVVAAARDQKALEELTTAYGDNVLPLAVNVTNQAIVGEAVQKAHEHFGRLDVVVNAAGYGCMGAIEEVSHEEIRANFDTNVFGTLNVIKAVIPYLREQKSGHIFTVSSIGGIVSFPTGGIYTATKFAVEAFSEALAGELAPFDINVTIIEPGSYATDFSTNTKRATSMPEYNHIRQAMAASFKPENTGDPKATAAVILEVVDTEKPPLRLILGSMSLPVFKKVYEDRLNTWDEWSNVSNKAQKLG